MSSCRAWMYSLLCGGGGVVVCTQVFLTESTSGGVHLPVSEEDRRPAGAAPPLPLHLVFSHSSRLGLASLSLLSGKVFSPHPLFLFPLPFPSFWFCLLRLLLLLFRAWIGSAFCARLTRIPCQLWRLPRMIPRTVVFTYAFRAFYWVRSVSNGERF